MPCAVWRSTWYSRYFAHIIPNGIDCFRVQPSIISGVFSEAVIVAVRGKKEGRGLPLVMVGFSLMIQVVLDCCHSFFADFVRFKRTAFFSCCDFTVGKINVRKINIDQTHTTHSCFGQGVNYGSVSIGAVSGSLSLSRAATSAIRRESAHDQELTRCV